MIGSQKLRMNFIVASLAIAFLCGPRARAQTGETDPNVQKAKDILLKGVASGNPDTRQLAVMSAMRKNEIDTTRGQNQKHDELHTSAANAITDQQIATESDH